MPTTMTAVAVAIGVAIFILLLLAVLSILRVRRAHNDTVIVKRSFGRHSAPDGVGIDDVRKQDSNEAFQKNAGKGRLFLFGVFIAGVIGTLTVRLWSLQLLSGEAYSKMAEENMFSEVSTPATRGRLLDCKGRELVGNRPSMTVSAPRRIASDNNIIQRLSLVLGIPKGVIRRAVNDDSAGAQADRIIARDVPMRAVAYIKEHPMLFEGVNVEERTVRYYPYGSLAAHVLGYIGPVTETDLLIPHDNEITYEMGDYIGKGGAEFSFEGVLQGIRGSKTYRVDVDGNPLAVVSESPPQHGADVCLTIDLDIQRATDRTLAAIIAKAKDVGYEFINAGAIVCLDVEDGGVLAASSYPTFKPDAFTDGISLDLWNQLTGEDSDDPLTNRVISGLYPAASTFKAFTGLAGLEHGLIEDETRYECTGSWDKYGVQWAQQCWTYPAGHGTLGLEEALRNSCDIFFYNVAAAFYEKWELTEDREHGDILQDYLRSWGFNSYTDVDLPGELMGRVPDAAWKKETFADTPENNGWQPGDMTNMIIGQGDILVTPLQLCNGFAGIARKKMLAPHVFGKILDQNGEIVVDYVPKELPIQPVFDAKNIARIEDGLARVIETKGGLFNALPVAVAGKSGTAEVFSAKDSYAWYVAYAPKEAPKYCVACVLEQGGEGSTTAVLGVQHTLAAIYGVDLGDIVVETWRTGER